MLALFLACALPSAPAQAAEVPLPPTVELYRSGSVAWLERGLATDDFATGSPLFDQEWTYGTWMMAAVGFGQHALAHPEARAEDLRWMEVALDHLLAPEGRAFDHGKWGVDPLAGLDGREGHAAWLGYTGLAVGLHRVLVPDSRYAEVGDRIAAAIDRRVTTAPAHLVATYPDEHYPVDNAAMIGALGLHTRATGVSHAPAVEAWVAAARARWIDADTGLLHQWAHPSGAVGPARGSGTFLAAWFLSYGATELGAELYRAGIEELGGSLFGYRMMREYPWGVDGPPDIDSGPVVAGWGVSATGFAMGAAGAYGDTETQLALARTARDTAALLLTLDPSLRGPDVGAGSGSHIGDGILFAMTSAR